METNEMTDFHAIYYGNLLTMKRDQNGIGRISSSIANANIKLMPHQVNAALFAYQSSSSKGVLLADEVGLGKTIEAGLVISQHWNEGKHNILVIVPASLRSQWAQEMREKFFIDSIVLDSDKYESEKSKGVENPFLQPDKIIICSYHFASDHLEDIMYASFHLAVIDEAHKLRNSWKRKPEPVISTSIYDSLRWTKKILLTATPIQNRIEDLLGVLRFIDDDIDPAQWLPSECAGDCGIMNNRIKDFFNFMHTKLPELCHRTLRTDVMEYVHYTERKAILHNYKYNSAEYEIDKEIDDLFDFESGVAKELYGKSTGIMRINAFKYFSSSPRALAEHFKKIIDKHTHPGSDTLMAMQRIVDKIGRLESDSKLAALAEAINIGFQKQEELGAEKKAIIFTEYLATQDYIREYLESNGYDGRIVMLNGDYGSPKARAVYNQWIDQHRGSNRVSGVKEVDTRQALIDYFRDDADILIATEVGGEGVNLQFCNLIINYDLPWNPQKIEQRIGRCHRYGQKFDVIVINFLNEGNEADVRVYNLLEHKLGLFNGMFGSSNEILGILEGNIDIEKRITEIYVRARTPQEIGEYFDQLEFELQEQMKEDLDDARRKLFRNLSIEVKEKLESEAKEDIRAISEIENIFWKLAKYELKNYAIINEAEKSIELQETPFGLNDTETGIYQLLGMESDYEYFLLRMNSTLGQYVLEKAKSHSVEQRCIIYNLTNPEEAPRDLLSLVGKSGYLKCSKLTIYGQKEEEFLTMAAIDDDYEAIDTRVAKLLFNLLIDTTEPVTIPQSALDELEDTEDDLIYNILDNARTENDSFLKGEIIKIEKFTDTMVDVENRSLDKYLEELNKKLKSIDPINLHARKKVENKIKSAKESSYQRMEDLKQRQKEKIEQLGSDLADSYDKTELFTLKWRLN